MLQLNTYQSEAGSVRLPSATTEYLLLGLPGEVGEVCSLAAKAIRDGRKIDHDQQMKKELGDVLWFISQLAADHSFSLEDIARANLVKLFARKDAGTLQGSGDNR